MENNSCRKNDRKDDKTMWELMPLDCLEDIARVYTEGAKKYGPNKWQGLENGYERYKGALLRHLYASESNEFDEETGCRHLAQVAWNAIAMLWLSKHKKENKLNAFIEASNDYFGYQIFTDNCFDHKMFKDKDNKNHTECIVSNYKFKDGRIEGSGKLQSLTKSSDLETPKTNGFMDPEYTPEMIIKCKKK